MKEIKNDVTPFSPISIILTLILVALKLDGVLECNWIWVLTPIFSSYIATLLGILILWIWASIDHYKRNKPFRSYGKPTYWDAKTGRIYGDFDEVD